MRSAHEDGAPGASITGVSAANSSGAIASTELGAVAVPGGAGAAWNSSLGRARARSLWAGRRLTPLVGRYEVVRLLGEGRRKRVYLAFDKRLDREVAIALIKCEQIDAADLAASWRQAQAMARLGAHQNIITIYDSGEDSQGRMYLVSEYLAGGELSTLIAGAAVPMPRVAEIATDVARALQHAHARGIVHGDIKPSNVRLSDQGVAKLGGFGSAQARDERSDVAALGAMIHQLVRGRSPDEVLTALPDIDLDTNLLREQLTARAAISCTGR